MKAGITRPLLVLGAFVAGNADEGKGNRTERNAARVLIMISRQGQGSLAGFASSTALSFGTLPDPSRYWDDNCQASIANFFITRLCDQRSLNSLPSGRVIA